LCITGRVVAENLLRDGHFSKNIDPVVAADESMFFILLSLSHSTFVNLLQNNLHLRIFVSASIR